MIGRLIGGGLTSALVGLVTSMSFFRGLEALRRNISRALGGLWLELSNDNPLTHALFFFSLIAVFGVAVIGFLRSVFGFRINRRANAFIFWSLPAVFVALGGQIARVQYLKGQDPVYAAYSPSKVKNHDQFVIARSKTKIDYKKMLRDHPQTLYTMVGVPFYSEVFDEVFRSVGKSVLNKRIKGKGSKTLLLLAIDEGNERAVRALAKKADARLGVVRKIRNAKAGFSDYWTNRKNYEALKRLSAAQYARYVGKPELAKIIEEENSSNALWRNHHSTMEFKAMTNA